MHAIRHLIAQRHLAVLICAAALLLKLLIPTGYMIGSDHGRLAIVLCPGTAPVPSPAMETTMAMPAMHGDMTDHGQDHGKGEARGEMPCAFSTLSAAVVDAVDPVLLAALIAFVLAIGLARTALPPPSQPARLRPPLRGPPAFR